MTEDLPSPIERYFSGKNARDFDKAVAGFSPSAIVKDEGHQHEGPAAIRAWIAETARKYNDRTEIRSFRTDGTAVEVTGLVSGTFPGSPIALRFTFTVDGDKITRLAIAP